MKKLFIPLIFILFLFLGLASIPVVASQTDLKTVKVGVYDNYSKIYKDTDGTIKGFWADITNAIAEKEGWDLEYVYDSWENNLARLDKGEIDLMVDVAVSDARKLKYDFTNENALLSWGIFYTANGVTLNSFSDLEGKNVAIMETGIHYIGPLGLKNLLASFNIKTNVIDVTEMADVFKLLDTKQADVGVVNWFFGIANEKNFKVDRTSIIFDPSELKYALPKNAAKNSYLISVLDFDLKELKEDLNSVYHQSIKTHFGNFTEEVEVTPKWLNTFLVIVFCALVLAVAIYLLMKRYQWQLRKEIENKIIEIKRTELRYKELFESLHDAIVIINSLDGVIASGNNAAVRLFGVKNEEELKIKTLYDFCPKKQLDGQLSSERSSQHMKKALETGQSSFEWILKRTDNKEISTTIFLSKILIRDKIFFQATIEDITEKKASERKVAELDTLRNKFINIVSHQLRTPLTAMRWSLEHLLEGKPNLSPEQTEIIQTVLDEETEAIKRIDDMLETLDIEEGRVAFNKTTFSLDSLLNSVVIPMKQACAIKQITFTLEIDPNSTYSLTADVKKIRMVLEHLLNNAVEYTNNNGKVSIKLSRVNDWIRFEIADTGIGIPLAEQANIFDRFFRGSNAALIRPDASGLGLTITKYYIEQHGGKIGFDSKEGEGSKFWFELPVSQ